MRGRNAIDRARFNGTGNGNESNNYSLSPAVQDHYNQMETQNERHRVEKLINQDNDRIRFMRSDFESNNSIQSSVMYLKNYCDGVVIQLQSTLDKECVVCLEQMQHLSEELGGGNDIYEILTDSICSLCNQQLNRIIQIYNETIQQVESQCKNYWNIFIFDKSGSIFENFNVRERLEYWKTEVQCMIEDCKQKHENIEFDCYLKLNNILQDVMINTALLLQMYLGATS